MVMPFSMQPLIRENGHHCIQGPRRQEEAAHQMVQEAAQGPEWEAIPIQQEIHSQEEDRQGPMVQEELNPQEEGIQAVIQAAAAHLHAQHLHSSQEEQAIQVAARQPHLQDYLDTPIHGAPLDRSRKP